MRTCNKPGLTWLDIKVFEWLERNGREECEPGLIRRTVSRRSPLVFMAGAIACMASFIQVDGLRVKEQAQVKRETVRVEMVAQR